MGESNVLKLHERLLLISQGLYSVLVSSITHKDEI